MFSPLPARATTDAARAGRDGLAGEAVRPTARKTAAPGTAGRKLVSTPPCPRPGYTQQAARTATIPQFRGRVGGSAYRLTRSSRAARPNPLLGARWRALTRLAASHTKVTPAPDPQQGQSRARRPKALDARAGFAYPGREWPWTRRSAIC